jgi:uncharacterized coiled-coil protein SlyX
MNSTPNMKDVLIAHTDEQLARAREGIASVREGIALVTEKLSKMERDDARVPAANPGDDGLIRVVKPAPQPPRDKSALRGSIGLLPVGLLLAACLVVAALVSQLSRDAVKMIADRWTPQPASASTSTSQPANPPLSAQPSPSFKLTTAEAAPAQAAPLTRPGPQDPAPAQAAQPARTVPQDPAPAQAAPPARAAAQNPAPAQAAPPARTAAQDAAPAAAGVSELMQLQQSTERDVANLKRENEQLKATIEQLKVKQGQMATDNSKAIEQLKAKLDDMTRQLAKVSEQSALARTPPPSAVPAQSLQARMRPPAPPLRRHYPPRWYYDDEW